MGNTTSTGKELPLADYAEDDSRRDAQEVTIPIEALTAAAKTYIKAIKLEARKSGKLLTQADMALNKLDAQYKFLHHTSSGTEPTTHSFSSTERQLNKQSKQYGKLWHDLIPASVLMIDIAFAVIATRKFYQDLPYARLGIVIMGVISLAAYLSIAIVSILERCSDTERSDYFFPFVSPVKRSSLATARKKYNSAYSIFTMHQTTLRLIKTAEDRGLGDIEYKNIAIKGLNRRAEEEPLPEGSSCCCKR